MTTKTRNIIGYVLVIAVFTIMFYNPTRIKKDIEKHSRYTIGTVFKESSSLKNGEHYHYFFYYQNKKYEGYNPKNRNYKVAFGNRYIVNFSYQDPEHCKILYNYPITKDAMPPNEGWDTIPIHLLN